MSRQDYIRLKIRKDRFKFSSAHMTVFPDGTKEALHGHNYRVALTVLLKSPAFEQTVCFSAFKSLLEPLCAKWDEKVLLAARNPFSKLESRDGSVFATICGKEYRFPEDEVEFLDVENISVENLCQDLGNRFGAKLKESGYWGRELKNKSANPVKGFELEVMESVGQAASCVRWRDDG